MRPVRRPGTGYKLLPANQKSARRVIAGGGDQSEDIWGGEDELVHEHRAYSTHRVARAAVGSRDSYKSGAIDIAQSTGLFPGARLGAIILSAPHNPSGEWP